MDLVVCRECQLVQEPTHSPDLTKTLELDPVGLAEEAVMLGRDTTEHQEPAGQAAGEIHLLRRGPRLQAGGTPWWPMRMRMRFRLIDDACMIPGSVL